MKFQVLLACLSTLIRNLLLSFDDDDDDDDYAYGSSSSSIGLNCKVTWNFVITMCNSVPTTPLGMTHRRGGRELAARYIKEREASAAVTKQEKKYPAHKRTSRLRPLDRESFLSLFSFVSQCFSSWKYLSSSARYHTMKPPLDGLFR